MAHRRLPAMVVMVMLTIGVALPADASAQWGSSRAMSGIHASQLSAFRRALTGATGKGVARPASRTAADASSLIIPSALWPQGTNDIQNRPVDISKIDDQSYNPFVDYHVTKYQSSGINTAFLQSATVPIGASGVKGQLTWLGTIYDTAAQAKARTQDTLSYLAKNSIPQYDCIATWPSCYFAFISVTNDGTPTQTVGLMFFVEGSVVGEVLLAVSPGVIDDPTNAKAIGNALGTLAVGADTQLRAAIPSAKPSVKITTITLQHMVSGKLVPTRVLRSGETGFVRAQFTAKNGGALAPRGVMLVLRDSQKVARSGMTPIVNRKPLRIVMSARGIFVIQGNKQVVLTARITLRLDTASSTKTIAFTVLPPKS